MSLENVLAESISNFASPSRDQLITLTIGQLQDLLKEAIQPLQDEVLQLKATVTRQDEKIASLESTQEHDVNRICLDICQDRQRLARLERVEPQPMQKDRGDILMALLAANGGKMLAKDARKKMRLDEATFSRLLDSTEEHIEKRAYHLDKRQSILIIK
jgi:uncharacterized membrane protein